MFSLVSFVRLYSSSLFCFALFCCWPCAIMLLRCWFDFPHIIYWISGCSGSTRSNVLHTNNCQNKKRRAWCLVWLHVCVVFIYNGNLYVRNTNMPTNTHTPYNCELSIIITFVGFLFLRTFSICWNFIFCTPRLLSMILRACSVRSTISPIKTFVRVKCLPLIRACQLCRDYNRTTAKTNRMRCCTKECRWIANNNISNNNQKWHGMGRSPITFLIACVLWRRAMVPN